jgi:hypothetical protein
MLSPNVANAALAWKRLLVLNLGRLVVHIHPHEGYFDAAVVDNTAEAPSALANGQGLAARLQTRLLRVAPKFPFRWAAKWRATADEGGHYLFAVAL